MPLQSLCPTGHWQAPATHCLLKLQTLLQVPQLLRSFCKSLQTPAQKPRPAVQKQVPPMHCSLVAHSRPQVPQLLTSACRFLHAPEHDAWPEGHAD